MTHFRQKNPLFLTTHMLKTTVHVKHMVKKFDLFYCKVTERKTWKNMKTAWRKVYGLAKRQDERMNRRNGMKNDNVAIKTNQLTKKYGEKVAVDHIDLEVYEGEMLALLGVNGAGKTTTIRMLSGLSTPTEGTAEIMGRDAMKEKSAIKSLVGISPQDTAVAENLTVEENLSFMAGIYLEKKEEVKERVEEILKTFHLEEVRTKRAKTLSGGWKRKLSIAMAIIGNPKILYLDEPTLGLDVLARRELWREIEGLKSKMTIILTTHYMEEAEALADRIAIMIGGRLVKVGTLAQLEEETGKKGLEEVFVTIAES